MLKQSDVDQYKKYLVEGLTAKDIYMETYYNDAGEPKRILIVKGDRFDGEYQGRIYASSVSEAVNEDGSIRTELMLETISEPFRIYQNGEGGLEEYGNISDMLEGGIL